MADGSWSLADAKAKLSEVVDRALREGPQHITRHGRPAVVVITEDEYRDAVGRRKSFVDVLFDPSVRGLLSDEEREAFFKRDRDLGRDVEL